MTEEQYQLVLKACRIAQSQGLKVLPGSFGTKVEDNTVRCIRTDVVCAIGALALGTRVTPTMNAKADYRHIAAVIAEDLLGVSHIWVSAFISGFDNRSRDPVTGHWYDAAVRMRKELGL